MTFLPGTEARRRIYLMRHGHVNYLAKQVSTEAGAISLVPLTTRGRLQAEAAGKALAHVTFDRAICSGYPRTRETAEHVLAAQEATPMLEVDAGLVEIAGGKMATANSRAELIAAMKARFATAGEPGATNHEGGEVYADAQARAVAALKRLLGAPGWHTALVVAHEGINRLLLSWACGAGLRAMGAFEQDTGCINVLDFDLDETGEAVRTMIKSVNLTPYNWLKHGMNLTSLEAIFERNATEELK